MDNRRRRLAIPDPISTLDDRRNLAGYTLDDVLAYNKKQASPSSSADLGNRTLLDIIREDKIGAGKSLFGHKDKRTWKSFRDKLRLRRAGSAWVSTVPIPTSDMPVLNKRFPISKRLQIRFDTVSPRNSGESPRVSESINYDDSPQNSPSRDNAEANRITRSQISRHNSISIRESNRFEDYTDPTEPELVSRIRQISTTLMEERTLSAREAVAAQEAADAASAAAAAEEEEEEEDDENEGSITGSESSSAATQGLRMSLMDLLHETDREMGLEGSSYAMGDESEDEDFYEYDDEEDEEEEEEDEEEEEGGGGGESECCVCRVSHRGAGMIPCGHTFCRMCSKELMVSRGNCPTCSSFILEIIHAF